MQHLHPKKDPKRFFYHLAKDFHRSLAEQERRDDSMLVAGDIDAFCGVFRIRVPAWSFDPVLLAFAYDEMCCDQFDADELPPKVLPKLRMGLTRIGLEELACYEEIPPSFVLVAQLANPKHDLKKAARELTTLVWNLADR